MKRLILLVSFLSFCLPIFVHAQTDYKFEGINIYSYADKPDEITFIYKDFKTGREIEKSRKSSSTVSPSSFPQEDVRIVLPYRWPTHFKELEFGYSEHAYKYKEWFEHAYLEVLNKRRGTPDKPLIKLLKRIDAPVASNGVKAYAGDGRNSIVMHPDNLYLNDSGTIALCQLRGHDAMYNTFNEADVFYNSNYFENYRDTDDFIARRRYATKTIVHEMGHGFGNMHTCWDEDIMLDVSNNVVRWNFEDEASTTWQMHKLRDRMIYSSNFDERPMLIPVDHSIVDITNACYTRSTEPSKMIYFLYEMINTNLHGREDEPLEILFYSGWQDRNLTNFNELDPFKDKEAILTIESEGSPHFRYPEKMSILHLDNQKNLKLLFDAIDDEGTSGVMGNHDYPGILKVTLVIRGYLKPEDREKHTIFSNIYLNYGQMIKYRLRPGSEK